MSPAELRELNYRELTEKLAESKEELFNLRFQWPPTNWTTPPASER